MLPELYYEMPYPLEDRPIADQSIEVARFMEQQGYTGGLYYYSHDLLDPWTWACKVIDNTQNHIPLIAIQPYTMPPATVAKKVCSIWKLHQRRVNLNVIAGKSVEEMVQVGDKLNYQERYQRIVEYITIIKALLSSNEPFDFKGKFYSYEKVQINAAVPREALPEVFLAAASETGFNTSLAVADIAVTKPGPTEQFKEHVYERLKNTNVRSAISIAFVARPTATEAEEIATGLVSKSRFHSISARMFGNRDSNKVYYYGDNHFGSGPLLVGSYEQVAQYLQTYVNLNVTKIIVAQQYNLVDRTHNLRVLEIMRGGANLTRGLPT